jgi:hypothetical protein
LDRANGFNGAGELRGGTSSARAGGGLIFGLIAGFFLRGKIATVEVVGGKRSFVSRMNIALWLLGYQPATQTEDFFTYRPSLELGMAGWRISVQLHEDQAVIFGPRMQVEKVIRALAEAG